MKIIRNSSENLLLGLQHVFVMFGATVLVPILTGLNISIALFASGIGTLIFHVCTKRKVPIYLGSSFSFIPPIIAVRAMGGNLQQACGGIVIAGLVYIIVAFIFKHLSIATIHAIIPSHISGTIILLIGVILAPVAIQNASGANAPIVVAKIGSSGCWAIAAITLLIGLFVKLAFEKTVKFLSMFPILIALAFGYIISYIFGIVDLTKIGQAAWVGLPTFVTPVFTISAITIVAPVALVTIIEHFGDILAVGNVVEQDFLADPGIHRTLIGDGLATSVSAMLGGPANTTYSENTGALALTGKYNPVIMEIAAVFAILLSLSPKVGAAIATIPSPVIGGISILLFGLISAIGMKTLVDNEVDFKNIKILLIVAIMLILGIGGAEFKIWKIVLSGLGLSAIVGIILNFVLFGIRFQRIPKQHGKE